ncbi:MAG TPA: FkbM family methyltransferase, partial [Sedimentisphaerales bacterium]|nr:FkbM family methyltransferase [Sedimentisphaerales bacterium]
FDISDHAKVCTHIEEILTNETYNLSYKGDSIVIDIGMNRAIASLFFASKENVKKVYAFEPFKPTVALAKKNLDLNPVLNKKIQIFAFGLGKENTTLEIPYSIDISDCMSTTNAITARHNVQTETVIVKDAAEILAPIFEENKNNRIIIKCDCEGAEFEILERLNEKNMVEKIDAILMEYHFRNPDALLKILTERGFAVHVIHGLKKEPITGYLYAVKMGKNG